MNSRVKRELLNGILQKKPDEDELVRQMLLNHYGQDNLQKTGKDYINI